MRKVVALAAAAAALWFTNAAAADPVIAAAGDIACQPSDSGFNGGLGTSTRCRMKYTSDLLLTGGYDQILDLGDSQYNSGKLSEYQASYNPSWGRVKSLIRPIPGNHEYGTPGAAGYFDYFGAAAGDRTKGYYSYNVGSWHIIALNSNCAKIPGGCAAGGAQEQWLRADLSAAQNTCALAYWHHPRYSSGHDNNNVFMQDIWQALYDHEVDVVLAGHSHNYERFAPMDANGALSPTRGIRSFVVGTGGAFFTGLSTTKPNSHVRSNNTYGVLQLTLHSSSYDWQFVPEAGKTFTDAGSSSCVGAPADEPDTIAPTAPAGLTAVARSSSQVDLAWSAASDDVAVTGYEIYRDGSFLKTVGAVTSAVDTTVAPARAYAYTVRARDAAANWSPFSNSASATTPTAGASPQIFAAEADARVQESTPLTNYAASYLRTDGGADPDVESYLRFPVSGITGSVTSAKLRVYAYTGSGNGPAVYSTTSAWTETGVTWSNRPARTSAATDDKGAIAANSWVEYDVKPFVSGNGTYSFVLATTSNDGVDIHQREVSSLQPQLVITTAGSG